MTANSLTGSAATAQLPSVEAYVLPHLIAVTAGVHGVVTSVDVVPHATVLRGQRVATLRPVGWPHDDDHCAVVVRAPVTGLVTSCSVSVGETLRRASPVVSIASSDNVLVSAKFPAGCSARIPRDSAAVVLRERAREPIHARIVSVIAAEWELFVTRVVVSLSNAPPEVLWPGTPVEVVI